jgi:hypothetical protein
VGKTEANMIVETNMDPIRNVLSSLVLAVLEDKRLAEDSALEIVEIIALRMKSREDYQVAAIGMFVRVNLRWLLQRRLSSTVVVERFTRAAAYAVLGHAELVDQLIVSQIHSE